MDHSESPGISEQHILYRIFDAQQNLLYVGATTNPTLRFYNHAQSRPWWNEASEIKLQHLGSLDELVQAELTAIQTENPKFNLMHSKPATWSRKPRGPRGEGTLFQRSSDRMWVGGITVNGRKKRVSARSREECELKLEELKRVAQGGLESGAAGRGRFAEGLPEGAVTARGEPRNLA